MRSNTTRIAMASLLSTLLVGFAPVVTNTANAVATSTSGTTITKTYTDVTATETLTIPDNVTSITITLKGAEGGRGGTDSAGRPPVGGYIGQVTGTFSVTPGQIITVGVGKGGTDSSLANTCSAGVNAFSGDPLDAVGGSNPLGGYAGGNGGSPGWQGCSGYGGSGGAATVVLIGTSEGDQSVATIVAGGSGGSGGSGQFSQTMGQISKSTFSGRADVTSTSGQPGLYTAHSCRAGIVNGSVVTSDGRCDGGGGAGGGGGALGGLRGSIEYGAGIGSAPEWFGAGANPGSNSTSGIAELTDSYLYTATNNGNGSVVISYTSGVPGAPTGVSGSPVNTGVDLVWTAPATVGSSAISGYTVQYAVSPYSSWTTADMCTGTGTTCAVTGLSNGTAYKFKVLATNATGSGSHSTPSAEVTPAGPPSAPTIESITGGDGSLEVAFTAGSSTLTITNYEYSIDNGANWISAAGATTPLTISGLTNGITYSVILRAVSASGPGSASVSASGTASSLPGAPTITEVIAGVDGTSLVVRFVAGYAGGSTITVYEYGLSPGTDTSNFGDFVSISGTASPFTISGLSSGSAYTVQLRAKNSAGYSPASAFRSGVTLAVPNAPVITSSTPGDQTLQITYTAYDNTTNGGSAISKVEYSVNNGANWIDVGTLSNPFTLSGLTNGTTYQSIFRATNAIGTSVSSTLYSGTPRTTPSAPNGITVSQSPTGAVVSWTAPTSNGGSAITGYTATAYSASTGGTVSGTACTTAGLTCTITGLTNGTTYYVSAVATNAAGSGPATSPRVSVIPAALPGAPTINTITAADARLSVAFTAGSSDENAPVTSYQYTLDGGTNWINVVGTSSPISILGLSNGTTYPVKIRAVSAIGNGADSNSLSRTPFTIPSPISNSAVTYSSSSGSVSLTWGAPNSNGSDITNYYVELFNNLTGGSTRGNCNTSGSLSCTISGLSNGTTYYATLQSKNGAGFSERSTPRLAVMAGSTSTVSLAVSGVTSSFGQTVTQTATATSGATGTVNFTVNGTSITGCSAVTIASSLAICTTTELPVGTNSLLASYSGNSTYGSSTSSAVSIEITKNDQTITFSDIANKTFGEASFSLVASASSGNAVTYTSTTTSKCTVNSSGVVTIVAAGTCSISVNQAGNSTYNAAPTITKSFTIAALAVVVITPSSPAVVIQRIRNLAVTVVETKATLTWTAITSPSIVIVRASDGTTINLTAPSNASTVEVSNLEPGFAYSATVTPDSVIDSSSADTVTFALAPSAPKDLQVNLSSGNLTMKWTGAKGSAQYRVAIVIPGRATEIIVTTNTQIVIAVTPGLTYTFTVAALGDAQLVSPVTEIRGKVPAVVTPTATKSTFFAITTSTYKPTKVALKPATAAVSTKVGKSLRVTVASVGTKTVPIKVFVRDPAGKRYLVTAVTVAKNKRYSAPIIQFVKAGTFVITTFVGTTKKVVTVKVSRRP